MGLFTKSNPLVPTIEATTSFVKEGRKLIDECFTSTEEKLQANQKLLDVAFEDRKGARAMYNNDSSAQKVLAFAIMGLWTVFTAAIFVLIYMAVKDQLNMPEWAYAMIGTAYGYINSKLGTVFDFFFGSSRSSQMKDVINKKA